MERISLPTRTVARKGAVVIPVTLGMMLLMLLGVWRIVRIDMAQRVHMRDFRRVFRNYQPIPDRGRMLTLFARGGLREPQNRNAIYAFNTVDRWEAGMCYLYARALWREYTGPEGEPGYTMSRLEKSTLPGQVTTWLRVACRRDPTNRFYRATLAGVLMRQEQMASARAVAAPPAVTAEIDRLLEVYPPLNAYGQVRTAERLVERRASDRARILAHFGSGVNLASPEVASGLVRFERRLRMPEARPDLPGPAPRPTVEIEITSPLGTYLVARALEDIIALEGLDRYPSWRSVIGPDPESHWLASAYFRSQRDLHLKQAEEAFARRRMVEERQERAEAGRWATPAQAEADRVVEVVRQRLKAQAEVSRWRAAWEMACPLSRPEARDRLLLNREIGYAAWVLRDQNDLKGARELYEIEIARRPRAVGPRMALAAMLIDQAEPISRRIKKLTDEMADLRSRASQLRRIGNIAAAVAEEAKAVENEATIKTLEEEVEPLYEAAEHHLSEVLEQHPRLAAALELRLRMGKARRREFEAS
jgi:hypothetical protein